MSKLFAIIATFTISLSTDSFANQFADFMTHEQIAAPIYQDNYNFDEYINEQNTLIEEQLKNDVLIDRSELMNDIELSIQESIETINKENIEILKVSIKEQL